MKIHHPQIYTTPLGLRLFQSARQRCVAELNPCAPTADQPRPQANEKKAGNREKENDFKQHQWGGRPSPYSLEVKGNEQGQTSITALLLEGRPIAFPLK
eukprot:2365975-Alexandrium_andersonii.AAC.1